MPYILNTDRDREEMLKAIGLTSLDELFSHLPKEIILGKSLNLPQGLSEFEVNKKLEASLDKNRPVSQFNSFLGAGCYDHYRPAALDHLASKPEFLTAYTPYQSETSQGALQAIYEYQSYICLLTGMDVSNASMFDGASSLAEAVLCALRVTTRNKILISKAIHPEYRETLKTYLSGFKFKLKEVDCDSQGFVDLKSLEEALDSDTACFACASPNFLGLVEDTAKIKQLLSVKNALLVLSANPMSFALFKDAGSLGVDIVCGDGQAIGGALNFGGPSFGYFATKTQHLRQMPGRLVGKTLDLDKREAYCLIMQAREQHIRREKATSNICSNQSHNAIKAAIYLGLMGKSGLKQAAQDSFNKAHYLYDQLKSLNQVKLGSQRFFNEFVWEIEGAKKVINKLYKKGIISGLYIGKQYPEFKNGILSCCTEKKSKKEIDLFVEELKKI